jgi:hypothetical protein
MAYRGSYGSVDVPALGRSVKRGEPIEIDDSHLCSMLSRQGWEEVQDESDNDKDKEGDGS